MSENPSYVKPDPQLAGHTNGNTEIARSLPIYYDSARMSFWTQNDRGGWIMVNNTAVRRDLIERGYRTKAQNNECLSQIDSLLNALQQSHDVDYAGSLAGYPAGVYFINEKRILVRDSPKLINPKPGECPLLQGIITNMLGPQQQVYLFGWLKVAIEALYSHTYRPGQVLTLAGPRSCGKSLLQNLFTVMLGNRSAKPHRYMSGLTPFNGDLIGCEHLIIEDEEASTDIRARRHFGTKIKEICANRDQSCHEKHRQALTLSPFWRLSISVNDEPENLLILPLIEESIENKLIILKAERHPMPRETVTDDQRKAFWDAFCAELPHFVHFLTQFEIPPELISQRYGITHFQHPDILEALGALSPETRLLEIIEAELFSSPVPGPWTGLTSELERKLQADSSEVKHEAKKLFSFPTACGTYLGRLRKTHPERFESEHTNKGTKWTINPPPT